MCTQFLDKMELMYDDEARQKGVYILGSCGYDTIPGEMGVVFTKEQFRNKFQGQLCSGLIVPLCRQVRSQYMVAVGSGTTP